MKNFLRLVVLSQFLLTSPLSASAEDCISFENGFFISSKDIELTKIVLRAPKYGELSEALTITADRPKATEALSDRSVLYMDAERIGFLVQIATSADKDSTRLLAKITPNSQIAAIVRNHLKARGGSDARKICVKDAKLDLIVNPDSALSTQRVLSGRMTIKVVELDTQAEAKGSDAQPVTQPLTMMIAL